MGINYEKVRSIVVEVPVTIYEYVMDDESLKYDWMSHNGNESDELFDSAEEAERDARSWIRG